MSRCAKTEKKTEDLESENEDRTDIEAWAPKPIIKKPDNQKWCVIREN
jgi:hypothetical protein